MKKTSYSVIAFLAFALTLSTAPPGDIASGNAAFGNMAVSDSAAIASGGAPVANNIINGLPARDTAETGGETAASDVVSAINGLLARDTAETGGETAASDVGDAISREAPIPAGFISNDLFTGIEIDGSYLETETAPGFEYDNVGIGAISTIPESDVAPPEREAVVGPAPGDPAASTLNHGSLDAASAGDLSADGYSPGDSAASGSATGDPTASGYSPGDPAASTLNLGSPDAASAGDLSADGPGAGDGSISGLMSDSGDFDLDFWMEGFDPDADFGGLGFETKTGPGEVSIGVYDTEGDFINGVVITEDGFRTDKATAGGIPYVARQVPYGKRVYGVYLTYSFDIDYVEILKHISSEGGERTETNRVYAPDADSIPPVTITDETARWEITFVLRQSMRIDVDYYLVSPNDRFYYLRFDEESARAYNINAFRNAPVRVAIYIEMPALKSVRKFRIEGEGFGDAPRKGVNAGAGAFTVTDDLAYIAPVSGNSKNHAPPWTVEAEYGDFSMADWTFTERSWQLVSRDSDIGPDNVTFIRFIILSLPSAYDGAAFSFTGFTLTMEDGETLVFDNPSTRDLTVRLVDAPRLL